MQQAFSEDRPRLVQDAQAALQAEQDKSAALQNAADKFAAEHAEAKKVNAALKMALDEQAKRASEAMAEAEANKAARPAAGDSQQNILQQMLFMQQQQQKSMDISVWKGKLPVPKNNDLIYGVPSLVLRFRINPIAVYTRKKPVI